MSDEKEDVATHYAMRGKACDEKEDVATYYAMRSEAKDVESGEALLRALKLGSLTVVQCILERGTDTVNKANAGGETPLYWASRKGYVEIVKTLIAAKADVNKSDAYNETPLYWASQKGYLEIVKALIAAKAEVNMSDNDGCTPLYRASDKGFLEVVKALIAAKAEVNTSNLRGNTPLSIASENEHLEIVKALIAAKASTQTSASASASTAAAAAAAASASSGKKLFSAEDLHVVRGRFYDLSEFDHPGGRHMIEQGKGQDITASVAAHHFTDAPYRVMRKFEVPAHRVRGGVLAGDVLGGGYSFKEDGFHTVLKRRIVDQLAGGDAQKMRQVTRPSVHYQLIVAATFIVYFASWAWCCFGGQFLWTAACLAGATRVVLVGIGHEAIHGRLGSGPLFYLFGAVLCFPSEIWHDEHVLQHHPHTKRDGLDPDEHGLAPMLRLNRFQKWGFWHAAQLLVQLIISFFFSMATWIQHTLVPTILSPKDPKQWLDFAFQTFSLFAFQLLPLFTAPTVAEGCFTIAIVVGMSNAFILHAFHVSHINENNEAVGALTEGMDWGEWQCRTSSNWDSAWYSVTGMLEYQIEHHLFPSLTYAQQNEIRPLVKRTCAEFDIPYFEYPSMTAGLVAHIKYLWGVSMDGFRAEKGSTGEKVD